MDSDDSFQIRTQEIYAYSREEWEKIGRETNYRRDYIDGDRYSLLETMCEMFDDKEAAWNDIRRRERMEQACYD